MSGREKENLDPDITRVRTKCVSSSGVLKPTQPKQNAEPTFSKNIPQRRWTKKEDRALLSLVEKYDDRGCIHKASMEAFPMWELVARDLKTRSARSCRNRWHRRSFINAHAKEWRSIQKIGGVRKKYKNKTDALVEKSTSSNLDMKLFNVNVASASPIDPSSCSATPLQSSTDIINDAITQNNQLLSASTESSSTSVDHYTNRLKFSPFSLQKDANFGNDLFERVNSCASSDSELLDIDLSPLDLDTNHQNNITNGEADTLLYYLCDEGVEQGRQQQAPVTPMNSTSKAYSASTNGLNKNRQDWCMKLMQAPVLPTPIDFLKGDRPVASSPFHQSKTGFSTAFNTPSRQRANLVESNLSTAAPRDIVVSGRYSAISTLTVTTAKRRKKRRVQDSGSSRIPLMPSLDDAKEIDLVFTDTKPFFKLIDRSKAYPNLDDDDDHFIDGNETIAWHNSHKSSLFEKNLTASDSPLRPLSRLSPGLSNVFRPIPRTSFAAPPLGALPEHSGTVQNPVPPTSPTRSFPGNQILDSPTHDVLVGMDLHRAMVGLESPAASSTQSLGSVDVSDL